MNYRTFSHEHMNFLSLSAIIAIVATLIHNVTVLFRKIFVILLQKNYLVF